MRFFISWTSKVSSRGSSFFSIQSPIFLKISTWRRCITKSLTCRLMSSDYESCFRSLRQQTTQSAVANSCNQTNRFVSSKNRCDSKAMGFPVSNSIQSNSINPSTSSTLVNKLRRSTLNPSMKMGCLTMKPIINYDSSRKGR